MFSGRRGYSGSCFCPGGDAASPSPSQEEGGYSEHKERVKQELLELVRLEKEVDHVRTALGHVDTIATGVQRADVPEVRKREVWGMSNLRTKCAGSSKSLGGVGGETDGTYG